MQVAPKIQALTRSILLMTLLLTSGASCDAPREDEVMDAPCEARPAPPLHTLRVGGTGAGLGLIRELARAYAAHDPSATPTRVPASLGSEGGLRALRDGALDVALLSRQISSPEQAQGLIQRRLAQAPIAFAVGRDHPARAITRAQLITLYEGHAGAPSRAAITLALRREDNDSGLLAILAADPALGAALRPRPQDAPLTWHTDQAMRDAILSIDGAIGWLDLGLIQQAELRPLTLDGVAPTLEHVQQGRYPLHRPIYLVTREGHEARARDLLDFICGEDAATLIAQAGYVPTRCDAP